MAQRGEAKHEEAPSLDQRFESLTDEKPRPNKSLDGAPFRARMEAKPGPPPILDYRQPVNLNDAILVLQLNVPFDCMYSVVYQKVQSSLGSMAMLL